MPTISIIVPVYNVENYLPTCLQSILNQTFKDFEAILVDDGSTDTSGSICDEFSEKDPRFIIIHQDNKGLPGARNSGLHKAKGEYISFVDSDDYIHPLFLETLYKGIFQTGTDVCMVQSKYVYHYIEPQCINIPGAYLLTQNKLIKNVFSNSLYSAPFLVVWNKIYSRKIIRELQMNDVAAEDLDFNIRVYLRIKHIAIVDCELYYYKIRSDSITRTNHQKLKLRELSTFGNLLNYISPDQREYRGYCLEKIYKRILLTRYFTKNTEYWDCAKAKIDEIKKDTLKEFRENRYITWKMKNIILAFLIIPWLYSFFIKTMEFRYKK